MIETHSLEKKNKTERLIVLADFLRKRREGLSPETVGITTTTKRRTPGLRREELAQLAGVSVSWYTWLEQGRDISVSADVLNSISRVLGLDDSEQQYLFQLANNQKAAPTSFHTSLSQQTRRELYPILSSFGHNPAYVLDQCWNLIAGNQNAYHLFVDTSVSNYDELPWREKNLIWGLFTNPYQKNC